MIMWIIFGYLATSTVASLLVYAACVASALADRNQERAFAARASQAYHIGELMGDDKRTERVAGTRLLLNA